MKVEILFPEVCNLYGDLQNVYYLRRCCPELEIVETDLHSKPRFLTEDVALVYMGSTTEQGLALAADALRPYTAEMAAKLDAGLAGLHGVVANHGQRQRRHHQGAGHSARPGEIHHDEAAQQLLSGHL